MPPAIELNEVGLLARRPERCCSLIGSQKLLFQAVAHLRDGRCCREVLEVRGGCDVEVFAVRKADRFSLIMASCIEATIQPPLSLTETLPLRQLSQTAMYHHPWYIFRSPFHRRCQSVVAPTHIRIKNVTSRVQRYR